jgi:hypothetical protein
MLSCSLSTTSNKEVSFTFDGQTYTLPSKVKDIQVKNQFKYFVYRGFRSQSENYTAVLQLDKNPLWVGSENVDESFYSNKKVVGITFIQSTAKINLNDIQRQIEINYKKKFTSFENTDYQKLETDEGIIVITSQKKANNYVSFYFDLKSKEIPEYVKNVW